MKQVLNKVKDGLFSSIHGNNLIYNACWEDPRCDHEVMNINTDSKIVVITSAGCNALDYALAGPESVNCVDVNPRQNATLELKIALAQHTDWETLFKFFGDGYHPQAKSIINVLKAHLSDYAFKYWSEKYTYFTNPKRSFYFRATSGNFAWIFNKFLKTRGIHGTAVAMVNAKSLEEQTENYRKIEKVIFSGFIKWMMSRHITMTMLGVPRSQRQLLIDGYKGGIAGFLHDALNHVFTELPIQDNYFWRAYITGSYTRTCCPEYLKEENFEKLKENSKKVRLNTMTITDFLKINPDSYTNFVLLDHQDWLAAHNEEALEEEWEYIVRNSSPNCNVLLRSAALEVDFLPTIATGAFNFKNDIELHQKCRVGTYCSTYVGNKV